MSRVFGIAVGLLVHAVFFGMVWYLFWFLKGDWATGPAGGGSGSIWPSRSSLSSSTACSCIRQFANA